MKKPPIPLDVLERALCNPAPAEPPTVLEALVLAAEGKPAARPTISQALAELLANPTATEPPTVLEALVLAAEGKPLPEPRTVSHIVDITDQFIGKTIIITGVKLPPK